MILDRMFGHPCDEEELKRLFNLDCLVNTDAERMSSELENRILSAIQGFFPKIGSEMPRDYYSYAANLEFEIGGVIIHVPYEFENQRGYFF